MVGLALVVVGLSQFMTAGAATAGETSDGTKCEVKVAKRGATTQVEGTVVSPTAIRGSYRISIMPTGGGGDIDQSGEFAVKPGELTSLGVVPIGAGTGAYNALFTVTWSDGQVQCSQAASGRN